MEGGMEDPERRKDEGREKLVKIFCTIIRERKRKRKKNKSTINTSRTKIKELMKRKKR